MENTELIFKAVEFAKQNAADNEISVEDVAANAGFSIDYFNRIFLTHTGFTVTAYMNYVRLKNATKLLRTTDKSVLEIALEFGYDSHEGFTKAFKKKYGVTPSEYRSKTKNQIMYLGEITDKTVAARFIHSNPDFKLLSEWIKRFSQRKTFYSTKDETVIYEILKSYGVEEKLKVTPQALYSGEPIEVKLPDGIVIRLLNSSDKKLILKWADGKKDGYINHLLNEKDYLDENNLEYGVFENGELIVVAGCGIDEVHGMKLNNCCAIRFADGKENENLYRTIFAFVTNDILNKGALPFDDIQHGDYAKTHGNFTSVDYGYEIVNRRYDIT